MKRSVLVLVLVLTLAFVVPLVLVQPQSAHAGPYSVFVQSAISTCYSSNSCVLNFPHHITVGDFVVIAWSGIWVECLGTLCDFAQPSATTTSVGSYASSFEADIGKLPSFWGTLAQLPNGTYVNTLMAGDIGSFNVTTVGMSNSIFTSGLTVSVTSGETMNSTTVVGYEVHLPLSFTTYSTLSAWWQNGGSSTAGSVNPLTVGEGPCFCSFSTPMTLPPASSVPGATNNTAWIGISRWTAPGTLSGNATFFKQSDGANYIAQNTTLITPSPSTGPNAFVADITERQPDTTPSGFGVGIGFFVDPTPSVAQPAECAMENSAVPIANLSVTTSLGFVSPAYLYCDGATHNFSLLPGTTMTISTPADGANTRYRYPGGNTTRTVAVCATGRCEQANTSIYLELRNDWQVTDEGQAAFDSGLSVTFTGTLAGVGSSTICSIDPITVTSTDLCSGWSDYDTGVTAPHFLSGASSGQWQNAGGAATTVTPVTGGNTENTDYYKQVSVTYEFRSAQFWTGTAAPKIKGTYLGATTTICSGSLTYGTGGWYNSAGGGTVTLCSGYTDIGGIASFPASINMNGSEFVSIYACSSGACPLENNYTGPIHYTSNLTASGFSLHTTFAVWYLIKQPASGSITWTHSCTGSGTARVGINESNISCTLPAIAAGEMIAVQGVVGSVNSSSAGNFPFQAMVTCVGSSKIVPTDQAAADCNGSPHWLYSASCGGLVPEENVNFGFPVSSSGSLTLNFSVSSCGGLAGTKVHFTYDFTVYALVGYSPLNAEGGLFSILGRLSAGAGYTSPGVVLSGFLAASGAFIGMNTVTNTSTFTFTRAYVLPLGAEVNSLDKFYSITSNTLSWADPLTLLTFSPSSAFAGATFMVYDAGPDAMSSGTPVCVQYKLIGGGDFNPPVLSYDDNGTETTSTLSLSQKCINASTFTIPSTLTGPSASATERARLLNASSGTFSIAGNYTFIYYNQFLTSFNWALCSAVSGSVGDPTLYYIQNGTAFTASLLPTPAGFWMDSGSTWRVTNPWLTDMHEYFASTAGGLINGAAGRLITITYCSAASCTSTNPTTLLEKGCVAGAIFFQWFQIFGPYFIAFLDFLPALAVYLRNESPAMAATVYILLNIVFLSGGIYGGFPVTLNTFVPILLGMIVAGSLFQLYRSNKGG